MQHNNGLAVISGEQASESPVRPRPANDATLAFLMREAIKLARGRHDATLLWLLHKAIERMKVEL